MRTKKHHSRSLIFILFAVVVTASSNSRLQVWGDLAAPTAVSQAAAAAVFKVGAGKRDITPKEAVPMWGYGDRHDRLSQGIIDPLYAAAVVIQAGDKKLAI